MVSPALCADDYVLALMVDAPERIAALSWQVDAPLSQAPDWARAKPKAWADAERLLALDPDLVVFEPFTPPRVVAWMERFHMGHAELAWTEDFDGVRANLRALGTALDRDDEATAVIADIDARLAALDARTAVRGTPPRVLYLDASARTAGSGVFVDTAIRAAGGRNAAAEAGVVGWGRLPLEALLDAPPDLVIASYFADGYPSASFAAVRHTLYRRLLTERPRVDVPGGDWACAGPRLIDAAEIIADGLDRIAAEDAAEDGT